MGPEDSIVLSREQCRAIDHYAIHTLGIPGIVLMENAGRNAAEYIVSCFPAQKADDDTPYRAAIICGKGNNGGDGFVVARHLVRDGWDVSVYLAADPASLTGDAATNYTPLSEIGVRCVHLEEGQLTTANAEWERSDVVVDALLGTGFSGQVREPLATFIRAINALKHPIILALDVPSGLDADTGQAGGMAVQADHTVTFLAAKPGFCALDASRYTGEVVVADIGLPLQAVLDIFEQ